MNNLFTYVLAVKEHIVGLSVLETTQHGSCIEDDDTFIESRELVVRFENGVTLRKQTEVDHTELVSDALCSECWISYEIIAQPDSLSITPNQKSFTNQCQEDFWLKMSKVQANI